jgi:antitoxin component YwqK of YwqJK toxin-antitoxin module
MSIKNIQILLKKYQNLYLEAKNMNKKSKILSVTSLATLSIFLTACSGNRTNQAEVIDETYVHRYGVAVPSDFWESSGEHGSVVSTLSDGVVVTKNYSSGTLDGETTYTYPHSSQIRKSESYQMGTLTKETDFYYDGTPKTTTAYNSPNPEMTSTTTWYLSGTPRSVECYANQQLVTAEYFTPLNQRDARIENGQGTRLIRDDQGELISTDTFQDGQMTLRQTYHPNGSPREVIPYQNGLVDGVKRSYQPAGEPDAVEQWANGKQEGMTILYHHGEKFAEIPYVNNVKHGVECRYRDGTTKIQEVSWSEGNLHGPTRTYIGDNVKAEWFYKGQSTSKADYEYRTTKQTVR